MRKDRTVGRLLLAGLLTVSVAVVGQDLPARPAQAAPLTWKTAAQTERSVPGRNFTPKARIAALDKSVLRTPAKVAWPAAGAADATLGATRARAGTLPVWVSRPATANAAVGTVRVEVLDRAATDRAGVDGLLFQVRGDTTGQARLSVDYSSFRNAYGGDWGSRLRLVRLPGCALTTPALARCQAGTPVETDNAPARGTLTADVALTAGAVTTLAATAAPAGSAGDYKATSLSASSSWEAGGSSGNFAWTYPMDAPPSLGGPEPDLELRYSSGSVDGRTASTNNQSSWVGEGWDLGEGAIERRYKSCSDDVTTTPKPYDMCWETDNAFLTAGGDTVELVKDDSTGIWRKKQDDGSRIEHLTGAANGDNDGEYWRVTAPDGTQYYYGLHHLPGWASGNEVTNSTWTAPVFGNDSGEPCHGSTFATSYCTQAYRWNLDYVVDPDGNAMSYFYTTETNYYGRNLTASAGTAYIRGGYLSRIDYGQRATTMYSAAAPMRVDLAVEERCATGATCGTEAITKDTAKNWPDTPYDQACASGATCTNLYAPTFWSRKRLASVTTRVLVSGTTYKDVDRWALGYQFRDPGDGTSPALWLASITRTGLVGGTKALPSVTFEGTQLENRVDALEGIPPMYKWRVTDIYDEAGGHTRVNYSAKDCTRAAPPTPDSNTRRCFPAYWVPEGAITPQLDWFHKYVPIQVLENDQSGLAETEETDYEYLGGAAWHHDDNELTPAKYRTWSDWRGYGRVRVTHGAADQTPSQTETLYFRGMNGDSLTSGTRSASVTDSEGTAVTDNPALAGFVREEISYSGVGGSVLDGEISDPWISSPTSTHGGTKAYLVGVAGKRSRLALAAGGWRRTEVQTDYDAYGLPVQVNDLGDTAVSGDEECNRITYARNTASWLTNYVVRQQRLSVACGATPSYPADVISDVRTFYDGATTFPTAPTRGDETLEQELASYSGGAPVYVQSSRSTYDSYGRVVAKYDALDAKTTTAFTPASGGPVTASTVTNAMGHVTTTTFEPAWGSETAVVDPNNRRTDLTYDPLGRLAAVWLSDRSKAGGETANLKFTYLVQTSAPNVVTTEAIRDDGAYDADYTFLDGQLRQRQTQSPAPGGGRIVTDRFYDSRGLVVKENGAYWNSGAAGTTLLTVADNTVPGQTVTVYDGDERETNSIFLSYGTEKWRTTTSYGGDRTSVTPPAGGTATTTITNADGDTTELRQYTSGTPTGSYDATKYTYTHDGALASVTDAAGNIWRYGYDLRGRQVTDVDPDKGTTTYTYDNADQVLTTTDARGTTLAYTYDALGRKTAEYSGSTSGTQLAAWTYDTLAKGQPTSSTRYVDGAAYTSAVTNYDTRYRPLGTTVTIPAAEGSLAGSYRFNTGYTSTGRTQLVSYPAVAGMTAETLRYGYDSDGRLTTAQTGLSTLLTAATYSVYDEPLQYTLQSVSGKQLAQTFFYEDSTRRLTRAVVDRSVSPTHLSDVNYTYDAAGNVTRIADTPVGGTPDTQCFTYDYLRRLTSAWTATDSCATSPSAAVLGGAAPYWQSWTYDKTGNRLSETNYDTTTGAGTTSSSTYPAAGTSRPHALSSVTTAGATNSFSYDAVGNTTGRTVAGSTQGLTWDAEGNLSKVVEGGKTTEFLYDADGNRLIQRDPDAVTLYLGQAEVKLIKATSALAATRYYPLGTVTAVRTSAGGLTFEAADRMGTAQLSVDADDLAVTQRRYLPFGELRGGNPAWPTAKGYVGGNVDSSIGLTQLGAREYDPDTGRFLSVDPIIDPNDPQQMNAYAYANNTPVTMNDADGEWRKLPGGHYCDGCGGYDNPPKSKKKSHGGKKKHKKASSPAAHHYCDGCDYQRYKQKAAEKHYCDGCNFAREAAEARKQAREYAAAKRRAEQAAKAKLAALKKKKDAWNHCLGESRGYNMDKCGKDPMPGTGQTIQGLLAKRIFISESFCVSRWCFKAKVQNGKLSLNTGTSLTMPKQGFSFPTIGVALKSSGRQKRSVSGSLGRWGVGVGIKPDGHPDWKDMDFTVGTNPAGGPLGSENGYVKGAGISMTQGWKSWCFNGDCK
ncbi:RHS repeat-associated core domain-containing protein [Micromonospora sp. NPDC048930]|uniref:RHS repeat-associated core domain-containing protein n=1 Tax=Micromonospora sp. NPDC048930 TaxID=3364261 RepID=UPI003715468D